MPITTQTTPIRSEAVQDILTKVPHWMIRWGSTLIILLIVMFLTFSWVIKYPDIITAEALLTTQVPPQKEYAATNGKIQHILVQNSDVVNAGTDLAVVENTANYYDVQYLKTLLDTLIYTKQHFHFPIEQIPLLFLGEIDVAYADFENSYLKYDNDRRTNPFDNKIASQKFAFREFQLRLNSLMAQKALQEKELEIIKTDLDREKKLFEKGGTSSRQIEQKELQYFQAQRGYKGLLNNISQTRENMNTSKNNFSVEDNTHNSEKIRLLRTTIQKFNHLKKAIYDWEIRYVLRAEIEGAVSFLEFWSINQEVNNGDLLFTIIPTENRNFLAKLTVPAFNSGKLKVGQQVYIKLENYPETEFGKIEGKIKNISAIADTDGNYLIDIALPNELTTTYNKVIHFKSEMTGSAEIITEDLRLLERLFYQFRSIFDK